MLKISLITSTNNTSISQGSVYYLHSTANYHWSRKVRRYMLTPTLDKLSNYMNWARLAVVIRLALHFWADIQINITLTKLSMTEFVTGKQKFCIRSPKRRQTTQ